LLRGEDRYGPLFHGARDAGDIGASRPHLDWGGYDDGAARRGVLTAPADILGLPGAAWAADDVGMLYDMAHRFMADEIVPRYDEFEKNGMVDRSSWEKAGAAGLLCASMPEQYG